MHLSSDIDFCLPLHVDVLHRQDGGKELIGEMTLSWGSIEYILDYIYEDHWRTYSGPKYFLKMIGGAELLILGSYGEMKTKLIQYHRWISSGGETEDD